MKTSETYKEEILEKYKREKGGLMKGFLTKPTRRQIREACLWLLDRRKSQNDGYILNRYFQFEEGASKFQRIQKIDADKFLPVVNFLKENTQNTSIENLELISWLIDFQPRPLQEYLRKEKPLPNSEIGIKKGAYNVEDGDEDLTPETSGLIDEGDKGKSKWGTRQITITISMVFGVILFFIIINKKHVASNETRCMTWAKTHYEEVSCATKPYSKYGTDVVPYEEVKIKNFKKIEVNMATDFFAPVTKKPLIWYTKNKNGETEYFTSPGLHPITGKTLDEITPYIIQKYVPLHSNKKESFVN
ncbi:hypothetical protein [Cellulophaga baltica]|uniref:Uncharacterized protein n=1 Tax=Cellulophaga baltica TaxID=76594 RepID=A0A1G7D427_9FLAO|nr:hypothetical protein [Cellulophaga baltica]SDE46424.1 hypothetical protein SAMN04487992_101347 [Cellulophaga baltica]